MPRKINAKQKYFIIHHERKSSSYQDVFLFEMAVTEIIRKNFSSVARALDYRSKQKLNNYAIQKIPNAITISSEYRIDESQIRKSKIPIVKPTYDVAKLPEKIQRKHFNSLSLPIEYEMQIFSLLPDCNLIRRYFEPRFDRAKPLERSRKYSSNVRGIEGAFLKECYCIVEEVEFDAKIVEIALQEALSEFSIVEFDKDPDTREKDFDWVEDPIRSEPDHSEYKPPDAEGVGFDVEGVHSVDRLNSLLPKNYKAYEYQAYFPIHVMNEEQVPPGTISVSKAVIVKEMNDDEFLVYMGTSAHNCGINNDDIRRKVKLWRRNFAASLLGASEEHMWVKFPQIKEIKAIEKLAKEIVEFCPDIINMNNSGLVDTEVSLATDGLINFWWD